ncbi:capsular polysaccharide synthesis protein [Mucisphaera sp.]|uniref:capsular polysaccharide synthesis protein n=1 Tax=Mucisphaera sp. TaxID=2913024 RepID=UPI003D136B09
MFTYWDQGIDQAPSVVRHGVERWRALHPEWSLSVLDNTSVNEYLAIYKCNCNHLIPQTRSDLLRYALLHRHGGLWVDSTTYPVVSLDRWLPHVLGKSTLFCFEFSYNYRRMDNWLVYADEGSKPFRIWFDHICDYWTKNRVFIDEQELDRLSLNQENGYNPLAILDLTMCDSVIGDRHLYHWSQLIFEKLVSIDDEFRANWKRLHKVDGHACTNLQYYEKRNKTFPRNLLRKVLRYSDIQKMKSYMFNSPVIKLDWREDYDLNRLDMAAGRVVDELLSPPNHLRL